MKTATQLRVVGGGADPRPSWRLPELTRFRVGMMLLLLGMAGWGYLLATSRYQALLVGCTVWVLMIVGWQTMRSRGEVAQGRDGRVVHHYHHRRWL